MKTLTVESAELSAKALFREVIEGGGEPILLVSGDDRLIVKRYDAADLSEVRQLPAGYFDDDLDDNEIAFENSLLADQCHDPSGLE
ncbi:MAG: hypothetical protein KDM91_04015 [Verrucomicrobiae bacterium]|nr:hypothetical protein [Verrucomicrobiae bacterium]MCP5540041.1 hypothetical protein [Akkermansiaceae bacterium]MCP5549975.1 hypothetical protein [Akkermansiaceae bacterium]